ncbi:MAG: alpha-2-macroglobulin family protein [Myxococcota bacterium]
MLLFVLACRHPAPPPDTESTSTGTSSGARPSFSVDEDVKGLGVRLYDASPPKEGGDAAPVAPSTPLDAATTERLLGRVPAPAVEDGDRKTFALREGTKPPPRTGTDVLQSFPPPPLGPPPAAAVHPPTIVRHSPDGEVPMAPHVSITFDQPMVAVSSQELTQQTVPATIEPQPPGSWRWLGTKTLMFDADPRLPMATEYRVTVPKGTKSASGAALAEAFSFTFATPGPRLDASWPNSGPTDLSPTVVLRFDQAVDPQQVLAHLQASPTSSWRLATDAEIEELPSGVWDSLQRGAAERAVVALHPREPLAKATSYSLTVDAAFTSLEGPRPAGTSLSTGVWTYAALAVTEHHCWYQEPCPPTAPWTIRTNNPLDLEAFDPTAWSVSPAVPGLSVVPYGDAVQVSGAFTGRTEYTLTVPASLRDAFGQTLGKDESHVFRVGPADKTLSAPGQEVVVLDPAGGAHLSVFSVNHPKLKVTVHEVTPEDWPKWMKWLQKFWYDDVVPGPLPGRRVRSEVMTTSGAPDAQAETEIDLGPLLGEDHVGQFVVMVEPTVQPRDRWNRQYVYKWVQVTNLGLVAFSDQDDLIGWATELATGAPLAGVSFTLGASTATSGGDGLAELALPTGLDDSPVLVARSGADLALLPREITPYGGSGWVRVEPERGLRWYVADDRGLYKPGESAKVKGWLRAHVEGPEGDVEALEGRANASVHWTLNSVMGRTLGEGDATLSGLGGFSFDVPIPADADVGPAQLVIEARNVRESGSSTVHSLQIQEFRKPEFEVSASVDAGPHLLGLDARVDVTAAYYAGGALANADTVWTVFAEATTYIPPGMQEWAFGTWSPWWYDPYEWSQRTGAPLGEGYVDRLEGKTDGAGQHHLGVHFESMNPPRPFAVRFEASVTDVNRQAWTATARTTVHPSDRYVGLKTERSYVEKGRPITVDVAVVDLDGKAATEVPTVSMARMVWRAGKGGRWGEQAEDVTACAVSLDDAGRAQCAFTPAAGGAYRVTARVTDAAGRPNESELRVWVSGEELVPAREVTLEKVTLVPGAQDLAVGESASLLIQAPFWPAEGTWTVRRDGIERAVRFRMDGPTTELTVPVDESLVPNFDVHVHLVGAAMRLDDGGAPAPELPKRVAHASGQVSFRVPPKTRTLGVTVQPLDAAVAPGGQTSLTLAVTRASGEAVANAEVAVVVVDESVLALTGYKMPDPIEVFYAPRGAGVRDDFLRNWVALANPESVVTADVGVLGGNGVGYGGGGMVLPSATTGVEAKADKLELAAAPMEEMAKEKSVVTRAPAGRARRMEDEADASGGESQAIALRTEFGALALFAPDVRTDAQGRATVPVKLPDSLTRYRVMVVAADAKHGFGSGEAAIVARKPLMVRASPPRFLNFGDQTELPVVVQNQTDADLEVDIAVRATHLMLVDQVTEVLPDAPETPTSIAGKRVKVPKNDRVEVRFPAATVGAGTARLQVVIASGAYADAAELSLPVWTPATTEAFATYGSIDAGVTVQPIVAPPNTWTQFGGLEVSTSSTQLQALTDAVLYLESYPYDCNEQIASRVLAIASLRDVLSAFDSPDLPPPAVLEERVKQDLEKLAARQHWNGGWSFWRRGEETWPYLSIYVADALARAKAKGYDVPEGAVRQSVQHLRDIESHIPWWYGPQSRAFLRAFAVDVLRRLGEPDLRKARDVYREQQLLGIDGLAFLLPTFHDAGAKSERDAILYTLSNRVTEEAGTAHFVTSYADGAHVLLHSDRRADGIVLEALMETKPDAELVEKVVRGLLAHRRKGHWSNTQEDAFILLALDRYFRTYEKETPDFVARVWLGDGAVGEHAFRGRTTEQHQMAVPMGYLSERRGEVPLTLAMEGDQGRMYYRVGMRYAPRDLRLEPADYGFAVTRRYTAIDDPADVRRDEQGVWHIRAGSRIKVELEMVNEMRRYHVALIDPLPAGLEAQNPVFATTGTLPQSPPDEQPYWWWWTRPWQEHEAMRDERVEAFTSLLWDGVHGYDYVARATTPGRYVVPPAKAEEMYMPETFGRSGTDIVVVE